MHEEFVGTMPVQDKHRFDTATLERYMRENVDGFSGSLTVEQFKGGQSNPTYRLSAGGKRYVLRRKPPGKLLPSAHAVDREYRVITALYQAGIPVAKTYALCEDENVIGTAFYIMDCVEGRVLWDQALPGMSPDQRKADLGRDEPRHRRAPSSGLMKKSASAISASRVIISHAKSAAGPNNTKPRKRKK